MSSKKRKKMPEKVSSKTSILSYFSMKNESPSKRFQGATLRMKNHNINSNNNKCKRKTSDKINLRSRKKKLKIDNEDPIVISSGESGDDENVSENTRQTRKSLFSSSRRKSKRKGHDSSTVCEEYSAGDDHVTRNSDTEKAGVNVSPEKVVHGQGAESVIDDKAEVKAVLMQNKQEKLSSAADTPNLTSRLISETDIMKEKFSKDIPSSTESPDFDSQNSDEENSGKIAYYLLNFCQVLDTVLENDDDRALFEGTDDMKWIEKFNSLPLSAQKLYVRLYHRKVAWLRTEQVNYPDISRNIHKILKKLSDEGFLLSFDLHNTNDLELLDVLKLLPAPALKDLAKSYKINVNGRQKTQIQDDICKMCKKQQSVIGGFFGKKTQKNGIYKNGLQGGVMKRACKILGPCYKVAQYPRTVFNRVLLVFDVTRGIDDEQDCTLTGSSNAMGQGRHLQLSAILMAGMGKVSYPDCKVDRPTPIFSQRADLLHYETAFQFQSDILACVEAGNWEEAAVLCDTANSVRLDIQTNDEDSCTHAVNLPDFLRCFTAQWTYIRLRSLEVEVLQRLKQYKKAVDVLQELLEQRVYCLGRRGHWWERLALNVDQHLKDSVRSLDVIHESLQDNDVRVGHKLALAQRVNKILTSRAVKKQPQLTTTYKTKLKPIIDRLEIAEAPVVEITGRLLPTEVQTGKSRFIRTERDNDDDGGTSTVLCSVEELALSHYKGLGYDYGIHGEGGTFSTLFCLFLWDIIFMPGIPDVFRTSYQTHPLDFHTDGFYVRRKDDIEKRLDLISKLKVEDFDTTEDDKSDEPTVIDILSMTWDIEYGKACAGMNWERFTDLEDVKGFIKCIGGKILSGIFRRFAKDLRHTRSGLPDLVVWNPENNIYKMVEVKGPGDRLSTNQKLWIDELVRLGANIEVCKVIAIGGKKLRD